jgi:hypothetical protein
MDENSDNPEILLETQWKGMQNTRWFRCSHLVDKLQHGAEIVAEYIKELTNEKDKEGDKLDEE